MPHQRFSRRFSNPTVRLWFGTVQCSTN